MTETNTTQTFVIHDEYILVEDNQWLNELCTTWHDCEFLAMDTEFIRTSTFFPKCGLIQINPGDNCNYLVDPLVMTDWAAFRDLMLNPDVVKVFHSCSEDMQVFMAEMQLLPAPVFDTQMAAAFLNDGFGSSYQTLVREYTGLELPKGETRSDWLQRPLDANQCHYAALDVACLPTIYLAQRQALQQAGRLAWLQEECEALLNAYRREMLADFSDYYLNLRGAWQLDRRALQKLKLLAQWREQRARKRNRPRNWIVQDKQLIDMARLDPQTLDDLEQGYGLDRNFLRHEGEEVLAKIREAEAMAPDHLPLPLPKPLDGRTKHRLKHAQQFVEQKAQELDLPVEILARKRWLISMLQNLQAEEKAGRDHAPDLLSLVPAEMTGWRKDLLFPGLLEAMQKS